MSTVNPYLHRSIQNGRVKHKVAFLSDSFATFLLKLNVIDRKMRDKFYFSALHR